MDSSQIRTEFLEFFKKKNHTIVDSASLVPENDPTLLFTNAGMVQFKDAFAGKESRGYRRAVSCQRCLRAGGKHNDLENVGYTARHHTFFEMLGNFSFGDYFKEEAILYAWEFLTKNLRLPPERLWVTVHESDNEAERIWTDLVGFDPARISRLGDEENFWTMGDTGPCGPSSEIFYDHGEEVEGGPPGSPESELDRYVEIWNLVFTQYDRQPDGSLEILPMQCVDTGMGLERITAVKQRVTDNYEIDSFQRLIKAVASLLNVSDLNHASMKVIADHIRSTCFLISDGVLPSNEGRGYVLRRIIRRALRHGHKLENNGAFFSELVSFVVAEMENAYPAVKDSEKQIKKIVLKEENQFRATLDQGLRILKEEVTRINGNEISGDFAFKLYDTYGFPIDLTADIARESGLVIDMNGFNAAMDEQKNRARSASSFSTANKQGLSLGLTTEFLGYEALGCRAKITGLLDRGITVEEVSGEGTFSLILDQTTFYAEAGGQIGDIGEIDGLNSSFKVSGTTSVSGAYLHEGTIEKGSMKVGDDVSVEVNPETREAIRKNHSATHLLHAALRKVLGEHVKQRGSRVSAETLRFDFSHFDPVSEDELIHIEDLVNEEIRENSKIITEVMDIDQAMRLGAMALFDEKYSKEVRVLSMGNDFSIELCGGTHAATTGEIRIFQIMSEQGIASGVRRIEATTASNAIAHLSEQRRLVSEGKALLNASDADFIEKISLLIEQKDDLEKTLSALQKKLALSSHESASEKTIALGDIKIILSRRDDIDPKMLPAVMDKLKNNLTKGIVVISAVTGQKIGLIVGVTKNFTQYIDAVVLANHIAIQVGGKGGGRPDMARAGGSKPEKLDAALASVEGFIRKKLSDQKENI
ncbi:MAG: alanine--tRNA ligase [Pseudomonadota bacterium]|nr:alanine--tRNA ligase [Pseudomonadota bacterium]